MIDRRWRRLSTQDAFWKIPYMAMKWHVEGELVSINFKVYASVFKKNKKNDELTPFSSKRTSIKSIRIYIVKGVQLVQRRAYTFHSNLAA